MHTVRASLPEETEVSRRPALVSTIVAALLLAGCAAPPAEPEATLEVSAATPNCDAEVFPLPAPAERIVAVKSTAAELVVALGLGDALVATAFLDGPLEGADAPTIDGMPSREAVLALEPDAIVAGWESAFAPEAIGDRAQLHELGVTTWVSPAACWSTDVPRLDWEGLFAELGGAAAMLGVPEAGGDLVDEQRAALAAIEPLEGAPTALWYSSGEDAPYVGGGSGAPQLVLETAGLDNVASDLDDGWATLSWEAVAASDPDVIVLVDAPWHTAASKLERLRANPATAALEAVREDRFVIVPFPMAEAGVGTVDAAALVAREVRELGLG